MVPPHHVQDPGTTVAEAAAETSVKLSERNQKLTRLLDVVAFAALCFLPLSMTRSQPYPPVPTAAYSSQFGMGIQRTMTLLATSTPAHRNTVRVFFYGQSITEQDWSRQVADWLRHKYPNANL